MRSGSDDKREVGKMKARSEWVCSLGWPAWIAIYWAFGLAVKTPLGIPTSYVRLPDSQLWLLAAADYLPVEILRVSRDVSSTWVPATQVGDLD